MWEQPPSVVRLAQRGGFACVERTLLSAASDFAFDLDSGTLSGRTVLQGAIATKPDSSWARGWGAPQPWRRKEQSDARSHCKGSGIWINCKPRANGPASLNRKHRGRRMH